MTTPEKGVIQKRIEFYNTVANSEIKKGHKNIAREWAIRRSVLKEILLDLEQINDKQTKISTNVRNRLASDCRL